MIRAGAASSIAARAAELPDLLGPELRRVVVQPDAQPEPGGQVRGAGVEAQLREEVGEDVERPVVVVQPVAG